MPAPPPPPPPRRGGAPLRPGGAPLSKPLQAAGTNTAVSAQPKPALGANTNAPSAPQQQQQRPRPAPIPQLQQQNTQAHIASPQKVTSAPVAAGGTAPALAPAAAMLSQSAIACWRTEYMAALSGIAGGVGDRLVRSGVLRRIMASAGAVSSSQRASNMTSTRIHARSGGGLPATKKKRRRGVVGSSPSIKAHQVCKRLGPIAKCIALCTQLKAHYGSHLAGGLGRGAPAAAGLVTAAPTAGAGGAVLGMPERLFVVGPSSSGDTCTSGRGAPLSGAIANQQGFRADDLALFPQLSSAAGAVASPVAATPTAAAAAAGKAGVPMESLTKLIVESQLMRRRLTVPPTTTATVVASGAYGSPTASTPTGVAAASPTASSPSVLGYRSVAAAGGVGASSSNVSAAALRRRVAGMALLNRTVIDRQLGRCGRAASDKKRVAKKDNIASQKKRKGARSGKILSRR